MSYDVAWAEAAVGPLASDLGDKAAVGAAVVGLGTAIFGVWNYAKQGREKRGRWLTDLQQRFVSEPAFRLVRKQLYVGDDSKLANAIRLYYSSPDNPYAHNLARLSDNERDLLVALDDYLEFFALIERLIEERELREDDAYTMFGWYVTKGVENEIWSAIDDGNQPLVVALRKRFKQIEKRRELARRHGSSSLLRRLVARFSR